VDEQAKLAPRSPYAASKAAGDLLAQAFHHTYGLPMLVVRPTNIFGPAQLPEKFIPLCITNGLDELPIPVYGDGQQRRAWLLVSDLCDALQVLLERGAIGEIYNVAGGSEQSNLATVEGILAAIGRSPLARLSAKPRGEAEGSSRLIEFVADRPGHDRRYAMNDGKLRALGWKPQRPFDQGLQETIAWYREHPQWWRPLAQRLREDPYHWLKRPARQRAQQAARALP
jgi:dTDP-glucose 4,6-dehydratase